MDPLMRDDPVVINLVARARDGDQRAWNEIVDRYAPLVWSICNRYKLSRQDIDDISQTVWLLLVEQLGNLRQPAALPGWLATTTQRECFRVLRAACRYDYSGPPGESQMSGDPPPLMIEQEIIAAELNAALRAAFALLPARCRHLLSMLITDPRPFLCGDQRFLPVPIGSISPQRARCLDRLRRSPFLNVLSDRDVPDSARPNDTGGGPRA
jgi:RNA polymerase sigma factor (sigma-70 family)